MPAILNAGISSLVRTLRFEWRGDAVPDRAVIAFWHAKMIAGWWSARKNAVALVSKSRDGERLAEILRTWKYKLVRGSSSKGGLEALGDAMELIRCGAAERLVITPDGPRGPRELMKRGAFVAAKELGLPLIFLDIAYENAKVLVKSWDHFEVPYPLSKVTVNVRTLDISRFPDGREEQAAYLETISASLRQ